MYSCEFWNQEHFRRKDFGTSSSWLPEHPLVDLRAGVRSAALCMIRPVLETDHTLCATVAGAVT